MNRIEMLVVSQDVEVRETAVRLINNNEKLAGDCCFNG